MADYVLTAELVYRGLCLVNLVAFFSFYIQAKGLCYSEGLAPTKDYMKRAAGRFYGSIFPPLPIYARVIVKDEAKESPPTERRGEYDEPSNADEDDEGEYESEDEDTHISHEKVPLQTSSTVSSFQNIKDYVLAWVKWASTLCSNIWARYYTYPTLFWISTSDSFHYAVFYAGMGSAVLGILGLGWPPLNLLICMICYLSFHVVGQPWLGLQMHVTLLETDMAFALGFLASFVSWTVQRALNYSTGFPAVVATTHSPFVAVFVIRFLVWRVMLGCGACKYGSMDATWRDLTAMDYHYFTQPLPNPLSYYMASLPHKAHAASVIATHLVEGPLSFFAFGNWLCRSFAFLCFVGLNLMINVTGNYGFLGILTVVQSMAVLDDDILRAVIPHFLIPAKYLYAHDPFFTPIDYLIIPALTLPYLVTSLVPLISTFHGQIPFYEEAVDYMSKLRFVGSLAPRVDEGLRKSCKRVLHSSFAQMTIFRALNKCELIQEYLYPFHVINRYAKFGTMTTKRYEIIIEGSDDGQEWREFDFKYKVGNPYKQPVLCPLHLPGIDWQIWFLPSRLTSGGRSGWFWKLMEAILQGKGEVMKLLGPSPFPEHPPKFVRAKIYDYKFCFDQDKKEEKEKKQWWKRKFIKDGGYTQTLNKEGNMVDVLPRYTQGR